MTERERLWHLANMHETMGLPIPIDLQARCNEVGLIWFDPLKETENE